MSKPPVSEQVQVNFRMPGDLRDRLKVSAEKNNRSMNAEIVSRLESSFSLAAMHSSEDHARGSLAVLYLLSRMAKEEPSMTLAELIADTKKLVENILQGARQE